VSKTFVFCDFLPKVPLLLFSKENERPRLGFFAESGSEPHAAFGLGREPSRMCATGSRSRWYPQRRVLALPKPWSDLYWLHGISVL